MRHTQYICKGSPANVVEDAVAQRRTRSHHTLVYLDEVRVAGHLDLREELVVVRGAIVGVDVVALVHLEAFRGSGDAVRLEQRHNTGRGGISMPHPLSLYQIRGSPGERENTDDTTQGERSMPNPISPQIISPYIAHRARGPQILRSLDDTCISDPMSHFCLSKFLFSVT